MNTPITVVGSVNLDIVGSTPRLPAPGETVTGATLDRHPGGKGANQALAARRLGATVRMVARVGADPFADEALALLRAEGVDLTGVGVDARQPTGVGLIAVAPDGENQIVVASGANLTLTPAHLPAVIDGALICQLEIPNETTAAALERTTAFKVLNLAPAATLPPEVLRRADLKVANDGEAAFYGEALFEGPGMVAITHGARGASLYRLGDLVAEAAPPKVNAIDATGAGDCFVAALTVALLEGRQGADALAFACAAGALACTKAGAQPSLPTRAELDALLGGAA